MQNVRSYRLETENHLGWKRSFILLNPTVNLTFSGPPLNQLPKCHIHMSEIPPGMKTQPLAWASSAWESFLERHDLRTPLPITCYLGNETVPTLLQPSFVYLERANSLCLLFSKINHPVSLSCSSKDLFSALIKSSILFSFQEASKLTELSFCSFPLLHNLGVPCMSTGLGILSSVGIASIFWAWGSGSSLGMNGLGLRAS